MLGSTHWYPLREKRWLKCTAVLMTVAAYCLSRALSSGCRIRAPLNTFRNSMISSPHGNSLGMPRNISSSSLIHKLFWRVSRPKSSFPAAGEKSNQQQQQSTLSTTASLTSLQRTIPQQWPSFCLFEMISPNLCFCKCPQGLSKPWLKASIWR